MHFGWKSRISQIKEYFRSDRVFSLFQMNAIMTQKCSEKVDKFNNLFVNTMNAVFRPIMLMEKTSSFQYSFNEPSLILSFESRSLLKIKKTKNSGIYREVLSLHVKYFCKFSSVLAFWWFMAFDVWPSALSDESFTTTSNFLNFCLA